MKHQKNKNIHKSKYKMQRETFWFDRNNTGDSSSSPPVSCTVCACACNVVLKVTPVFQEIYFLARWGVCDFSSFLHKVVFCKTNSIGGKSCIHVSFKHHKNSLLLPSPVHFPLWIIMIMAFCCIAVFLNAAQMTAISTWGVETPRQH